MVNYNKSIIYKLCCKNPEIKEIYIGSTINFTRRKCNHKFSCNNINSKNYNVNVYQYIRDNGGFDNFDMVCIEKFECNDKLELHKRERYWLEQLGATLNMCVPSRSSKEYYDNNKNKIKEYKKEYYEDNIEKIKEYITNNKNKIKDYQKQYRANNKENIKEKSKQYYIDNK